MYLKSRNKKALLITALLDTLVINLKFFEIPSGYKTFASLEFN